MAKAKSLTQSISRKTANAARVTRARVAGDIVAQMIVNAARNMTNPRSITRTIKEIGESVRHQRWLRDFTFNKTAIASGISLVENAGVQSFRNLLRKKPDDRVSKKLLMVAIAYIEDKRRSIDWHLCARNENFICKSILGDVKCSLRSGQ